MKKIRFLKVHGRHQIGHVIGTNDSAADQLVSSGTAEAVGDDIRPYKYAPGQAIQSECVVPVFEEMEASPKGAVWPAEIQTAEMDAPVETATKKYKQKINKNN